MTEELLPLFCPRWFLNCYMKLLALIYPVSAALPIWGKLLIVILLCRFFLGHVSTLISSIASVMMIAIKIHLQSAVSALLCSKLVLTHLAAQLIIKKLFSCSLVAPYSSKSTEQRTTLWLFLIFFFFFLQEHHLIWMGIVHRQWFLLNLDYKSQFTPDAKAASPPIFIIGESQTLICSTAFLIFPKTIQFLEWFFLSLFFSAFRVWISGLQT